MAKGYLLRLLLQMIFIISLIALREAISTICVIRLPAFPKFLPIRYTHNTDTVFLALLNIHKKGTSFLDKSSGEHAVLLKLSKQDQEK